MQQENNNNNNKKKMMIRRKKQRQILAYPSRFAIDVFCVYIADQTVVSNFACFLVAEVNVTARNVTMYDLDDKKENQLKYHEHHSINFDIEF